MQPDLISMHRETRPEMSPHLNICTLLFLHDRRGRPMPIYPVIEIPAGLRRYGHNVTWVIWGEGRRLESYDRDGIKVYATPERDYLPGGFPLSEVINLIPNTIRRAFDVIKIVTQGRYDLIMATDYVFDGLIAAYLARRLKIPFVFQLQNPLEQVRQEYEIYKPRGLFFYRLAARVFEFVGRRVMQEADLVLPISESLAENLTLTGMPPAKIMACPSGVDTALFDGRDGKVMRLKYGLGDTPVIIYIGTLVKPRRLELIIRAFALAARRRKVKMLVAGSGNDEVSLKKLAHLLGVANDIIFTGQVPQVEVPDLIAAADVGVAPVPPTAFYRLSSPIKLVEYMAMGKPVVANAEIPEQARVINASGAGILVPFTAEGFALAVGELLNNPRKAADMGERGRAWVVANRSYDVLARRLEARFTSLVEARRRQLTHPGTKSVPGGMIANNHGR